MLEYIDERLEDPAMLIMYTAAYMKETGDFEILTEQLAEQLRQAFDHLMLAGLPADLRLYVGKDYIGICENTGRRAQAEEARLRLSLGDSPADSVFGPASFYEMCEASGWDFTSDNMWMLGIRADYDGLRIDPCIPGDWDGFNVRRSFRGAVYDITVVRPRRNPKKVNRLIIDGEEYLGNVAPAFSDGRVHKVKVIMESRGRADKSRSRTDSSKGCSLRPIA